MYTLWSLSYQKGVKHLSFIWILLTQDLTLSYTALKGNKICVPLVAVLFCVAMSRRDSMLFFLKMKRAEIINPLN